jgi:hypothetical protein
MVMPVITGNLPRSRVNLPPSNGQPAVVLLALRPCRNLNARPPVTAVKVTVTVTVGSLFKFIEEPQAETVRVSLASGPGRVITVTVTMTVTARTRRSL